MRKYSETPSTQTVTEICGNYFPNFRKGLSPNLVLTSPLGYPQKYKFCEPRTVHKRCSLAIRLATRAMERDIEYPIPVLVQVESGRAAVVCCIGHAGGTF